MDKYNEANDSEESEDAGSDNISDCENNCLELIPGSEQNEDKYFDIDNPRIHSWKECEIIPSKFIAGKSETKKVVFAEYEYNHHETNKSGVSYRCCSSRKGCKASLKFCTSTGKWFHKMNHNHPTPALIASLKKNTPRMVDLNGDRQMELRSGVMKYKRTKALADICAILNMGVNSNDNSMFIYPQQVKEAREKYVYTQDVKTFEDICNRNDLSLTRGGQQYVRVCMQLPVFIFMLSADWQLNMLRQLCERDQLFIDGTFKVCPLGVTQMVTLLVKKNGWSEALPIVHTLLKSKEERSYNEMFRFIILLATNNNKQCILKDICITISLDFEIALMNSIRRMLPNAKLIGCRFHLLQAIFTNISKKKFGSTIQEDMENEANRNDLKSRIFRIIECNNEQSYIDERASFVTYYSVKKDYDTFLQYMIKNWLGSKEENATFPYLLWTKIQVPSHCDIHYTNNLIETFHKNINMKFSSKPGLKRCIEILQDIETDHLSKKQEMENHITVVTCSVPTAAPNNNTSRSSKKRKSADKGITAKKKRKEPRSTSANSNATSVAFNQALGPISSNPVLAFPTFGNASQMSTFNFHNSILSQIVTPNNGGNQSNNVFSSNALQASNQCNTVSPFQPFGGVFPNLNNNDAQQ
jgi:hypothetical protein